MNNVLCRMTDAKLNECTHKSDTESMDRAIREESYATSPMVAVKSVGSGEEDLHTSFEAAISDRLLAMRERVERMSGSLPYTQQHRYNTDALPVLKKQPKKVVLLGGTWVRSVLFGCFGLMLTLIGFDLMALLILYTR